MNDLFERLDATVTAPPPSPHDLDALIGRERRVARLRTTAAGVCAAALVAALATASFLLVAPHGSTPAGVPATPVTEHSYNWDDLDQLDPTLRRLAPEVTVFVGSAFDPYGVCLHTPAADPDLGQLALLPCADLPHLSPGSWDVLTPVGLGDHRAVLNVDLSHDGAPLVSGCTVAASGLPSARPSLLPDCQESMVNGVRLVALVGDPFRTGNQMNAYVAVYPNGVVVTVSLSAFTLGAPPDPVPVLTADQLRAIALEPTLVG